MTNVLGSLGSVWGTVPDPDEPPDLLPEDEFLFDCEMPTPTPTATPMTTMIPIIEPMTCAEQRGVRIKENTKFGNAGEEWGITYNPL